MGNIQSCCLNRAHIRADKSEGPHSHSPIIAEEFESGHLKPGSHGYAELSQALVTYIRRISQFDKDQWAPRQKRAWENLKARGTYNSGNPNNIDDLKMWFDIFVDAFFGGLLIGACSIEVCSRPEMRRRHHTPAILAYCEQRLGCGRRKCRIVVAEIPNYPPPFLAHSHL